MSNINFIAKKTIINKNRHISNSDKAKFEIESIGNSVSNNYRDNSVSNDYRDNTDISHSDKAEFETKSIDKTVPNDYRDNTVSDDYRDNTVSDDYRAENFLKGTLQDIQTDDYLYSCKSFKNSIKYISNYESFKNSISNFFSKL